jgi:hypothetical protein
VSSDNQDKDRTADVEVIQQMLSTLAETAAPTTGSASMSLDNGSSSWVRLSEIASTFSRAK